MLINGKRSLAYIAKITNEMSIENCDNIKLVTVNGGWNCIATKEELKVGDKCVYIEIDSKVPAKEPFLFLEKRNYKVKTLKMRGVVSQGLAMNVNAFKNLEYKEVGEDVTDLLGITHTLEDLDTDSSDIEKLSSIKKFLMRFRWYRNLVNKKKEATKWPKEVSKTDEEKIENCTYLLKSGEKWVATEKIDGTSTTYLMRKTKTLFGGYKYKFIVCSRNRVLDIKKEKDSIYFINAEKYKIKDTMKFILERQVGSGWLCIQGESIGPKVQGNKYKLEEPQFYVFNIIMQDRGRLPTREAKKLATLHGLKHVPIINEIMELPKTMKEMKELADGKSMLANTMREGIVFRSLDGQRSFKNVSNKYLIAIGKK